MSGSKKFLFWGGVLHSHIKDGLHLSERLRSSTQATASGQTPQPKVTNQSKCQTPYDRQDSSSAESLLVNRYGHMLLENTEEDNNGEASNVG